MNQRAYHLMLRLRPMLAAGLILLAGLPAAAAQCAGRNLIAAMPAAERQALADIVALHPNAEGNLWRATRNEAGGVTGTVHVVGTLHLFDARMTPMMETIGPLVDDADLVLVEAGRDEMAALENAVATRPELLFRPDGPTLPEVLDKAEWQALSTELKARGIPPFLASKFQPWYVSMLLGVPVCAMQDVLERNAGLDELVMRRAEAAGVPIRALEPYDTVFRLFAGMAFSEQIDMIRTSLAAARGADDMYATLSDTYFAQGHRLIWEFTRQQAQQTPGHDPARMAAEFAAMEQVLLVGRNTAWMDVLLPAAAGQNVVVAVGAAHLSGADGVLNLLSRAGYRLERLPL